MTNETETPTPHVVKPIYALSGLDGTGAKITHVLLKGHNYANWAKGFRNGLGAKRKVGFIEGTVKKPASGMPDYDDWFTTNCTFKIFT
ncbi:hypothetical protein vseg_011453 [Gypsophila vaccaria]